MDEMDEMIDTAHNQFNETVAYWPPEWIHDPVYVRTMIENVLVAALDEG